MDLFSAICRIVLQRAKYTKEIIVPAKEPTSKTKESVIAVLRTGDGEAKLTPMSVYACTGYVPNTKTIIKIYKIAAGPKKRSIVVLKETDCPSESISHHESHFPTQRKKCHEIIELIEYLSYQYVITYL